MRQWILIAEGKFRSQDVEEFRPSNEDLDDIKSKFLPDWEMLDHRTLEATYVAEDHRHAAEFVNWINRLSEKMDHFALITQDVSEVTIKTTTTDVDGLTILDFELAMRIDKYARSNNIEQTRGGGNFD
jgi:pterin-4a-carbinolamine dehydratase